MDSPDGFPKNLNRNKIMKSPIKILSTLVLGSIITGTAIAGPSTGALNAQYASPSTQNNPVGIALFRSNGPTVANAANCSMIQKQSKVVPAGNPKNLGVTTIVTGYKSPGCVGTMSCKGSKTACATMLQGN